MKISKTTFFGALACVALAVKPLLDGSGYNLDAKTVMEMSLAAIIALGGYFAKDKDHE